MPDQAIALLREQIPYVLFGTVFLFVGLSACGVALMRRGSGVKLLTWMGIWSAIEGNRYLFAALASLGVLPHWFRIAFQRLDNIVAYLVVLVALLAFLQISQGKFRRFFQGAILAGLVIAVAGIAFSVFAAEPYKMMGYNQLLVACSLAVLAIVAAVPKLSRKFLVLSNRGILTAGILVFAIEAVYGNLALPLGYKSPPEIVDPLGFAFLLLCFGYAAVQRLEATPALPVEQMTA